MAVLYKFHQIKGTLSPISGKWVARTEMTNTVDLQALAKRIERNCTAKRSDVLAVLTELVEAMTDELENSHAVKINGFGTFRVGMSARAIDDPKNFVPATDIKKVHLNFFPEISGANIKGTKRKHAFIQDVKLQIYDPNQVKKTKTETKTGDSSQTNG